MTYTTLDRQVLDLSDLVPAEKAFLEAALSLYRSRAPWKDFVQMVYGRDNPLLKATGGKVTPEVYRHPLFRAVRDLEDRLGILQGEIGAEPGDLPNEDPTSDEWLPVSEAAALKGVTPPGLHEAIRRGDLIARPAREGGKHLVVSRRSLDVYNPSTARQRAGRLARTHTGE